MWASQMMDSSSIATVLIYVGVTNDGLVIHCYSAYICELHTLMDVYFAGHSQCMHVVKVKVRLLWALCIHFRSITLQQPDYGIKNHTSQDLGQISLGTGIKLADLHSKGLLRQ